MSAVLTRRSCLQASVISALMMRGSSAANVRSLTDGQEEELGEHLWHDFAGKRGIVETRETLAIEKYLTSVGAKLTHHLREPMRYTFTFDPAPDFTSAMAFPGGRIITGGGILAYLDSEDGLAAVLGHEIMHIDLGHTDLRTTQSLAERKLSATQVDQLPWDDFGNTYSHEQELAADLEGVKAAVLAGYSPFGMRRLFEVFQFIGRNTAPRPGALTIEMRLAQLDALIAKNGWNNLKDKRTPLALP